MKMTLELVHLGARCATLTLPGDYYPKQPCTLLVNGAEKPVETATQVLTGLIPDTRYDLRLMVEGAETAALAFVTPSERYTLDVRRFGAVGDGLHDDTAAIQAAIMACPPQSRVLVPKGRYLVRPLFLKSHLSMELASGAELLLATERESFPVLPGVLESWDEKSETYLGTWEGDPLDMYGSLLTGVGCVDVHLYGEGTLNGQADKADWWVEPKKKRGAWRGRLLFLNDCRSVTVEGLHFCNSPAWNIHPFFSEDLAFYGITVTAPADSPNTDGFDPESCKNVTLLGAHFSLGDDCIAIKSGKRYLGRTRKTPCEHIVISHCLMENGHGGVTVGSEMSGGVKEVTVSDCLMRCTDRGLRIKTRRGRGAEGVIDGIVFERVKMERVKCPLTVNALYCCDPDGHDERVQTLTPQAVDGGTPVLGSVTFRDVTAAECQGCAAYVQGLPEKPMESLTFQRVRFDFAPDAAPIRAIMSDSAPECLRRGLVARDVKQVVWEDVTMTGQDGAETDLERVADFQEGPAS